MLIVTHILDICLEQKVVFLFLGPVTCIVCTGQFYLVVRARLSEALEPPDTLQEEVDRTSWLVWCIVILKQGLDPL